MEPYVSPERWSKELVAAGFQEPELSVLDKKAPYQVCAIIVASRQNRATKPTQATLLCREPCSAYVADMRHTLEALDVAVDICTFGKPLPAAGDVISLLDLEEPVVHAMDETAFVTMVSYLQKRTGKLLWLTQASQVDCEDPRAAMVLGLARSARQETGVGLFTVELDKLTPISDATRAVAQILMRINTRDVDFEHADPDYEFAISDGQVLIPRLHWQTISDAFKLPGKKETTMVPAKSLRVETPGRLQSMYWEQGETDPLGPGEVLVQSRAAGLNFRVSIHLTKGIRTKYQRQLTILCHRYRTSWSRSVSSTTPPRWASRAAALSPSLARGCRTWRSVIVSYTWLPGASPRTSRSRSWRALG